MDNRIKKFSRLFRRFQHRRKVRKQIGTALQQLRTVRFTIFRGRALLLDIGHFIVSIFRPDRHDSGKVVRRIRPFTHIIRHGLQDIVHPAVVQHHGIIPIVENPLEQRSLDFQCRQHPLLERILRYHIEYLDITALSDTVHTSYALLQNRRIPRQIQIYHPRCNLQIQSRTSSIRGYEHSAGRLVPELLHQSVSFLGRHFAVQ